ncbi:MAG TPA: 1-acyl-sn-glycerol-3-phosphate acyltransferase [Propylenella sp.]
MADLRDLDDAPAGVIDLSPPRPVHIADQLIAERGQKIVNSRFWPIVRPLLYKILHYREAVQMADEIAPLSASAAMEYVSALLSLDLDISGLERVPSRGAFIMAANHPTGIADGVAVYDAVRRVRPDIAIFTNRDALRINPRLSEFLIPVEWREAFRDRAKTRETLQLSSRAFREERAVVLFPSGRIAYWRDGKLTERPWQSSAVTLARKQGVPIVPVNVRSRNSGLFYWFANWNTELRDMTVFHELLNKRGKTFRISIGPPIAHDRIAEGDPVEVTQQLQAHVVERLAENPDAEF